MMVTYRGGLGGAVSVVGFGILVLAGGFIAEQEALRVVGFVLGILLALVGALLGGYCLMRGQVGMTSENSGVDCGPGLSGQVESYVEKSVKSVLADKLLLAFETGHLGLQSLVAESSGFDYGQIIQESRKLTIVLNDGRTWLSTQRERLRKRFADPSKETVVFLIHPRSAFVEVLARKGSKDARVIRERIMESVEMIEDISSGGGRVSVLGHFLFNPQSVVIGDGMAVVTPYYFGRGGRAVPAFVFKDAGEGSYVRLLTDDLELLLIDSEALKSSTDLSRVQDVAF